LLCCAVCFSAKSQVKNFKASKGTYLINEKLLHGKWQCEDDANWLLMFDEQKLIEVYDNEHLDTMFYNLSKSCDLKDSSSSVSLLQAFLLFGYNTDSNIEYYKILNFNDGTLSCMNNKTGEFFIFKRVDQP